VVAAASTVVASPAKVVVRALGEVVTGGGEGSSGKLTGRTRVRSSIGCGVGCGLTSVWWILTVYGVRRERVSWTGRDCGRERSGDGTRVSGGLC
jgi:hypothetical protein